MAPRLDGKVAIVTGASRGIGRGIALQLAEAGAVVYITGRTLRSNGADQDGSLHKTAEEIESRGGKCIAVQCDHSDDEQVVKLFETVAAEQNGCLDILVNNAFSAAKHIADNIGKSFWELGINSWDIVNDVGLRNHYHCAVLAARMMVPKKQGLIVNISSVGGLKYLFNVPYGVGKSAMDRMAQDCGRELRKQGVTMLALWPGLVQTELIMNLSQDKKMKDANRSEVVSGMEEMLDKAETVEFTGVAIAHLAADNNIIQKAGKVHIVADLAQEYGFQDVNGKPPPNMRAVSTMLGFGGYSRLAAWMPGFIKIPRWMFYLAGYKF